MTEGCLRTHCIPPNGSDGSVSFVVPMVVRKQIRDIGHVHGHLSCTTCAVSDLGLAWPRSSDGYLSSPEGRARTWTHRRWARRSQMVCGRWDRLLQNGRQKDGYCMRYRSVIF